MLSGDGENDSSDDDAPFAGHCKKKRRTVVADNDYDDSYDDDSDNDDSDENDSDNDDSDDNDSNDDNGDDDDSNDDEPVSLSPEEEEERWQEEEGEKRTKNGLLPIEKSTLHKKNESEAVFQEQGQKRIEPKHTTRNHLPFRAWTTPGILKAMGLMDDDAIEEFVDRWGSKCGKFVSLSRFARDNLKVLVKKQKDLRTKWRGSGAKENGDPMPSLLFDIRLAPLTWALQSKGVPYFTHFDTNKTSEEIKKEREGSVAEALVHKQAIEIAKVYGMAGCLYVADICHAPEYHARTSAGDEALGDYKRLWGKAPQMGCYGLTSGQKKGLLRFRQISDLNIEKDVKWPSTMNKEAEFDLYSPKDKLDIEIENTSAKDAEYGPMLARGGLEYVQLRAQELVKKFLDLGGDIENVQYVEGTSIWVANHPVTVKQPHYCKRCAEIIKGRRPEICKEAEIRAEALGEAEQKEEEKAAAKAAKAKAKAEAAAQAEAKAVEKAKAAVAAAAAVAERDVEMKKRKRRELQEAQARDYAAEDNIEPFAREQEFYAEFFRHHNMPPSCWCIVFNENSAVWRGEGQDGQMIYWAGRADDAWRWKEKKDRERESGSR